MATGRLQREMLLPHGGIPFMSDDRETFSEQEFLESEATLNSTRATCGCVVADDPFGDRMVADDPFGDREPPAAAIA